MKNPKLLLRGLQLATIVVVAAITVMGYLLITKNPVQEPQKNPKVKRYSAIINNKSYNELLDSGDKAFFGGNLDSALASYQRASALEPRQYAPYEKIGDIYFAQKDYAQSRQNYEMAKSINSSVPSLQLKIVKSILGLRQIVLAKTELEKIQPQTQESVYYQGLLAAFLNEQGKAKDFLNQSLALGNNEKIKSNAQKILTVYRDFDLAREAPLPFLQAMLAQAFDQIGASPLAIELSFAALKNQNDYRDVWIILGHAFLNEKKWLDGEDALAKAIQLDSSSATAFFFKAVAERNLQKNLEAVADLNQALRLGWQPRISANLYLADIYFDLKDFPRAFGLYSDVVKTDLSDINRFTRPLALAINHLNKPQEALALASTALKAHPDDAMALNLMGWALTANNNLTAARQTLNNALAKNPELSAAYLNLGQLEERETNVSAALQAYKKAMELADKSGDESIRITASQKYDRLMANPNLMPSAPQPTSAPQTAPQSLPSLSLL